MDWARLEGDDARSEEEIVFLKKLEEWLASGQKSGLFRSDLKPNEMIFMTAASVQYWITSRSAFDIDNLEERKKKPAKPSKDEQASFVQLLIKTIYLKG